MVLVCNHPQEGQDLADNFKCQFDAQSAERLAKMKGQFLNYSLAKTQVSEDWLKVASELEIA